MWTEKFKITVNVVCDTSLSVKFNHSCYVCEQNHITKRQYTKKSIRLAFLAQKSKKKCVLFHDQRVRLNNCNSCIKIVDNFGASLVVPNFGSQIDNCPTSYIGIHEFSLHYNIKKTLIVCWWNIWFTKNFIFAVLLNIIKSVNDMILWTNTWMHMCCNDTIIHFFQPNNLITKFWLMLHSIRYHYSSNLFNLNC